MTNLATRTEQYLAKYILNLDIYINTECVCAEPIVHSGSLGFIYSIFAVNSRLSSKRANLFFKDSIPSTHDACASLYSFDGHGGKSAKVTCFVHAATCILWELRAELIKYNARRARKKNPQLNAPFSSSARGLRRQPWTEDPGMRRRGNCHTSSDRLDHDCWLCYGNCFFSLPLLFLLIVQNIEISQ